MARQLAKRLPAVGLGVGGSWTAVVLYSFGAANAYKLTQFVAQIRKPQLTCTNSSDETVGKVQPLWRRFCIAASDLRTQENSYSAMLTCGAVDF